MILLDFWGNMKVLLGHLDWGLGTKDLHNDPADNFFWSVYCQQCFKVVKPFVKNGANTSAAGSCNIRSIYHMTMHKQKM